MQFCVEHNMQQVKYDKCKMPASKAVNAQKLSRCAAKAAQTEIPMFAAFSSVGKTKLADRGPGPSKIDDNIDTSISIPIK